MAENAHYPVRLISGPWRKAMKARTLYYCPADEDELLFEEIYDEKRQFDYQPPHELPEVCPKCGRLYFKKDCITVEELYRADRLPKKLNFEPKLKTNENV